MSHWRNCGVCKKSIIQGKAYQKCSISSCRKHAFCSVHCWDVHQSVMGHKSAWAEEEIAPSQNDDEERPQRRIVVSSTGDKSKTQQNSLPKDVLIVVSKMKAYVKAKEDMNTSGDVADVLSDYVRLILNQAMDNARAEGRKTVMARDFSQISL